MFLLKIYYSEDFQGIVTGLKLQMHYMSPQTQNRLKKMLVRKAIDALGRSMWIKKQVECFGLETINIFRIKIPYQWETNPSPSQNYNFK